MALVVFILVILFSIMAGVLPTCLYVLLVWRLDRYEKEPLPLLAAAFLWGAVPATVLAIIVEVGFEAPLSELAQGYAQILGASIVAPIVEETVKGLAVLVIYWLARSEFDDVLDGIIYGSLVGLGFAMTENVFYYVRAAGQNGLSGWVTVVLGRSIAFGFNHAMFTSLTGVGLGLARYTRRRGRALGLALLGWGSAMLAHFFHNFFVSAADACWLSFIVDWLGVLGIAVIVGLAWRRERAWLRAYLPEEVTLGVLTALQAEMIISRRERLKQAWRALSRAGAAQLRLWRNLADASTELAFKKHQLARMGDERGNGAAVLALRRRIMEIRQSLEV